MAYDLIVGKSKFIKDNPEVIASIEFDEYPVICSLVKERDIFFLNRISNLFEDQTFSIKELERAKLELFPLITKELKEKEKTLLYKLIACISYAIEKGQPLHGVSD